MRRIQMVDLQAQHERLKRQIDSSIMDVVGSAAYIRGPQVAQFEEELAARLHVRHVIGVGNGTDAIRLALMALDLKPGDEVITPSFTFVATAEVAAQLGLRPVLVDVDERTFCISPAAIRRAIGPRTRVIVPVHLFGQNADMSAIMEIAKEHGLYVVEDACQSMGSTYTIGEKEYASGCAGLMGCTSFFPSKNLGCYGDGGAVFTNNDELALRVRSLANHGMTEKYRYDRIGLNSRLDTIQAAVLLAKLPQLDDFVARRTKAAEHYDTFLSGNEHIIIPKRAGHSTHAFHQYTIQLRGTDRDKIRSRMADRQIPTMVYYPVPIHQQDAYRRLGLREQPCPNSELLSQRVLSLPMHTELDSEQLHYITSTLLHAIGQE